MSDKHHLPLRGDQFSTILVVCAPSNPDAANNKFYEDPYVLLVTVLKAAVSTVLDDFNVRIVTYHVSWTGTLATMISMVPLTMACSPCEPAQKAV
ncbi:hypothetical protein SprV_0401392800 [Sparganum proliferum]